MFLNKKAEKLRSMRKCVVNGCDSNSHKDPLVIFHKFPAPDKQLVNINYSSGGQNKFNKLNAWKTILNMKNTSDSMRVCSLHFKKEDYYFPGKCEFES